MKQFFLLLALLFAGTAQAQTVISEQGLAYAPAELRLAYIPDDSAKPFVTVFGNGPRYEQVVKWFDNGELKRLKDSSHFNAIDTSSVIFKERYAATTSAKLCIRIQDGDETYEVSDGNVPLSAEAWIKQTNSKAEGLLRKSRTCPFQQPAQPQRDPPPQPLSPPVPAKPKEQIPWVILGVLSAVGAIAGAHKYFRDLYRR